jgi:hypothetical protein
MEDRALFEVATEESAVVAAVEPAAVPESDGDATGEADVQDAGAEAITPDQREAELAERAAVEAAEGKPETEGTEEGAPAADAQPTGRRAQRMARRKAGKEAATG